MGELRIYADSNGRVLVEGPLTFATVSGKTVEASRGSFRPNATEGPTEVDLSGVSESDSAGLALLIEWVGWCRQRGRELHFVSPPQSLLGIAALCDVGRMLGLQDDQSRSSRSSRS